MNSYTSLIHEIERLVNKIDSDEHILTESQLKQFMIDHHIDEASAVTIAEFHVLAYIGDHPYTNAISISKALEITRGGISKIAARLRKKGLIEVQEAADNKREISYVLTSDGRELHSLHTALHQEKEVLLNRLLSRYSDQEIACIAGFLSELTEII